MNTRNVNNETTNPSAFNRFEQYSRVLNSLAGHITFVIARVLFTKNKEICLEIVIIIKLSY